MRLRVEGEGPLVIKLAGAAGGVELFREEIDAAVAAGYRVAALDNTGDRRDDPAGAPLTWERFTGEIESALDRLTARRAILWGTSFGSTIALAAAVRIPDRISGLLLCFPPDPSDRSPLFLELLRRVERSRNPELLFRLLFVLIFGGMNAWEFIVPTALVRTGGVLRRCIEAGTPSSTVIRKLRMLWEEDPIPDGRLPAMPARLIAGGLDPAAPAAGAGRLAARLPDSRLEVIHLAGHSGAFSRPGTYKRMALEALRELSRSG